MVWVAPEMMLLSSFNMRLLTTLVRQRDQYLKRCTQLLIKATAPSRLSLDPTLTTDSGLINIPWRGFTPFGFSFYRAPGGDLTLKSKARIRADQASTQGQGLQIKGVVPQTIHSSVRIFMTSALSYVDVMEFRNTEIIPQEHGGLGVGNR